MSHPVNMLLRAESVRMYVLQDDFRFSSYLSQKRRLSRTPTVFSFRARGFALPPRTWPSSGPSERGIECCASVPSSRTPALPRSRCTQFVPVLNQRESERVRYIHILKMKEGDTGIYTIKLYFVSVFVLLNSEMFAAILCKARCKFRSNTYA